MLAQDTILLDEIFRGMLLMFVQPIGESEQLETKRIQT